MGVLKGFRKYNKTMLAAFTALLMVSFLISGTFKGCGSDPRSATDASFFDGGYSVSRTERFAAGFRWKYVHAVYRAAMVRHLQGGEGFARGSNVPALLQAAFQSWRPCRRLEQQAEGIAKQVQFELQVGIQFGGVSEAVPTWIEFGPAFGMMAELSPTPEEVLLRLGKAEAARRLGIRVTAKDVDDYVAALGFSEDDLRRTAHAIEANPTPRVDDVKEALAEELLVLGHMSSVLSGVQVSEPQFLRFLRQNVDQISLTAAVIDARDFSDGPEFQPDPKDPKVKEELKKLYDAGKDKVARRVARGIPEHDRFRMGQRETAFGYKLADRAAFEILKVPDTQIAKMTDAAKARIAKLSGPALADFEERAFRYYQHYDHVFPPPREEKKEEPKEEKKDPKTDPKTDPKKDEKKIEPKVVPPAGEKKVDPKSAPPEGEKKVDPKGAVVPEAKPAPVKDDKKVESKDGGKVEPKDGKPAPKEEKKGDAKDEKKEPSAAAPNEPKPFAVEEEIQFLAEDKAAEKAPPVGDAGKKDAKADPAKDVAPKVDPAKAVAKPEVKPEAKSEAKPEVKPEVKPEAKPEVKPDPKAGKVDPTKPDAGKPVDPKKADPAAKKTGKADDKTAKVPELPPDPEAAERAAFAKVKEAVMVRLMIEDMLEELVYAQTRPAYRKAVEAAGKDPLKVAAFSKGLHPFVGAITGEAADPKAPKKPLAELDVRSAFRQEFGVEVEYHRSGMLSREELTGLPLEQAIVRGAMSATMPVTRNEDSPLSFNELVFRTEVIDRARRDREKKEREKQKTPRRKGEDEEDDAGEPHALSVGDVGPPLRGPVGEVYLVRLLAAEGERVMSFEEAADQLAEDHALNKAFEFLGGVGAKGRGKAHEIADAAAKSPDSLPSMLKPKSGRSATMHTLYNLATVHQQALDPARSLIRLRNEMQFDPKSSKADMLTKQRALQQAMQQAAAGLSPLRNVLMARTKEQSLVGSRVWLSRDNFLPTVVSAPNRGGGLLPFELAMTVTDPADQQELVKRAFALLEENPRGVGVLPLAKQYKVVLFSLAGYLPAPTDTRGQRPLWSSQARSLAAQQLLADYSDPAKLRVLLGYQATDEVRSEEPERETAATP